MDRHVNYVRALPWSMSMLGADIRDRIRGGRCPAEQAWILDEELTRRFAHRRPQRGLCPCERLFCGAELWWWPFSEDKWEPHPEDALYGTGMFSSGGAG